jgi:hypothetical protein
MDDVYRLQLDWLKCLAMIPGWKAYAWHRAKQLDADRSGLWTGIADQLVKEVKKFAPID